MEVRYVFPEGHSIRLDASSSNFARLDRNPNTGHEFAEDAETQVANRQVLRDSAGRPHALRPVMRS